MCLSTNLRHCSAVLPGDDGSIRLPRTLALATEHFASGFLHRESLRAFSSLKMQSATKAARRLSQVMGLGSGTTSAYISATWGAEPEHFDEELIPDSHSIPEVGPLSPSAAFFPSSRSRTIGQRISMFFGVDPDANENFFRDQGEVDRASSSEPKELVSRMKRKMTTFLAITSPCDSPEGSTTTAAESSDAAEKRVDLSSFNRSGDRKRPKQGAVKPTSSSRKRGAAISSQHQVQLLSTLQLISITFFAVSGGPYGFEPTVGAGGPGLMLLGLLVVPIVWAAPLAFMTAELSCMIPESGGHVLWVYRAFGPFWSFVNSCFAFTCSVLDNALYPVLFVEYLSALIYEGKQDMPYGWSVFIKIFIIFIVTVINILGISIVGMVSVILGMLVLAPFISMCLIGLTHLNFDWMGLEDEWASPPGTMQPSHSSPVDWGKFLILLLWNTSGSVLPPASDFESSSFVFIFDAAGTCASEVRNPGQAFPKALTTSVGLMVGVYALPTLIGVSVLPDSKLWKEGTYVIVAKLIGGNILKGWMGFSAVSSALGLLLTRLCTNSRIVYGMALVEQAPSMFSKLHPVYATPWVAILATSICTLFMTGFNFYSLAEANMLFYAFSTILKFASLVQLRYTEPDAFRPYRVPLGDGAMAAAVVLPIGSCIAMLAFSSVRAQGIGLVGASLAVLLFIVKELFYQYGSQAEEAVQDRMARVQQNLDSMQRRIDKVIQEEFTAPVRTLGDAIPQLPHQIVSGVTGLSGPVKSLGQGLRGPVRSLGNAFG
ncbi:hypothetical protein R1flu_027524 [Riccia fluitans]|uniref:Amino acid permease n=1 Tax=Riccia fluitans TaxID=41844 RepID=A0ABD1XM21_9MARC